MDFIRNAQGMIGEALSGQNHQSLVRFLEEESGQDIIEYVLLASVLGLFAIAGVKGVAANVLLVWQNLANGFANSI